MRVVAYIPARSGSLRLPDKNISSLVDNYTLSTWAIASMAMCPEVTDIVYDSDSKAYLHEARSFKALVSERGKRLFFRQRPKNLAKNETSTEETVRGFLTDLPASFKPKEPFVFLLCQPTSPFRTRETVREVINTLVAAELHRHRIEAGPGPKIYCYTIPSTTEYEYYPSEDLAKPKLKEVSPNGNLYAHVVDLNDPKSFYPGVPDAWRVLMVSCSSPVEDIDIDYADQLDTARAVAFGLYEKERTTKFLIPPKKG